MELLRFENRICHECNRITPTYRYCHENYGSLFKQKHGWYIKRQTIEYGIFRNHILRDKCPQEVLDLYEISPESVGDEYKKAMTRKPGALSELQRRLQKQEYRINRAIENEVRIKFGHKKVGEAWTSETILYYLVKSLLPGVQVHRHFRPDFMEGLELDIFIPSMKLAIEYQGIQHFEPVKHWGGQEALKRIQERDRKKREICNELGIQLIYYDYKESLDREILARKLGVERGSG